MDKLTAMATFVKVVDTGSFTRAADALDLPKTRVSQRISDLEKHLGVRLLNRTTRALSLTDDGAAYFDKCKALLQQIDELESTLSGETAAPIGRLRVDSLVSIARWVIAPKLHDFQARYPRIQLRLSSSDRISHLLEDGIDCTIRGGALKDSSMIARHLCDIQMGLYASPDYLASVGGVDTPDALLQLKRISWFSGRERNPFVWELEAGHARFVLQSGDGMQFDEPDVAMSACMAGSGICPGRRLRLQDSSAQAGWFRCCRSGTFRLGRFISSTRVPGIYRCACAASSTGSWRFLQRMARSSSRPSHLRWSQVSRSQSRVSRSVLGRRTNIKTKKAAQSTAFCLIVCDHFLVSAPWPAPRARRP